MSQMKGGMQIEALYYTVQKTICVWRGLLLILRNSFLLMLIRIDLWFAWG